MGSATHTADHIHVILILKNKNRHYNKAHKLLYSHPINPFFFNKRYRMVNKKALTKFIYLLTGILIISLSYGTAAGSKSASKVIKKAYIPSDTAKENQAAGQEKRAEDVYKNIKVFKGMPASRLIPTMKFIEASLGANCGSCHVHDKVKGWEFDSDAKSGKKKARKMVEMMDDINQHHFMGHQEVTCYTCHGGHFNPAKVPALLTLSLKREENQKDIKVANRLNTAEEIIAKYVKAIGGKEAFKKITTLKYEGTMLDESGKTSPVTEYKKAPNKILTISQNHWGEFTIGYNGEAGWYKSGPREDKVEGDDLAQLKDQAEFYKNIDIEKNYSKLRLSDVVMVDGDTAYEVKGSLSEYLSDKLYFDVSSGLLIRKIQYDNTPLGSLQEQTDYKNYKEVDGVMLPTEVIKTGYDYNQRITYSSIKANEETADKIFDQPAQ